MFNSTEPTSVSDRPRPTGGNAGASKLSPLDLRQHGFPLAIRGFDREAVNRFLTQAAADYEWALLEVERLRRDLAGAESQLHEHRARDTTLRNALMTAQKVGDDIKASARDEAKAIVREAENRAELLLEKAQGRLMDIERDIDEMRARRRELEASVEKSISAVQMALETVRSAQAGDDRVVLLHRRRLIDASAVGADRAPGHGAGTSDAQHKA